MKCLRGWKNFPREVTTRVILSFWRSPTNMAITENAQGWSPHTYRRDSPGWRKSSIKKWIREEYKIMPGGEIFSSFLWNALNLRCKNCSPFKKILDEPCRIRISKTVADPPFFSVYQNRRSAFATWGISEKKMVLPKCKSPPTIYASWQRLNWLESCGPFANIAIASIR